MKEAFYLLFIFCLSPLWAQTDDVDELLEEKQNYQQSISEIQEDMQGDEMGDSDDPTQAKVIKNPGGTLEELKKKYIPEMKENPLATKSKSEVKEILMQKIQGSQWESFFQNNPRVLSFVVDFLHHPDAFIKFASILNKQDKLRRYFYCFVIIFILSFYLRSKLPKNVSLLRRFSRKVFFTLAGATINLITFYIIFNEELYHTVEIFSRHFL